MSQRDGSVDDRRDATIDLTADLLAHRPNVICRLDPDQTLQTAPKTLLFAAALPAVVLARFGEWQNPIRDRMFPRTSDTLESYSRRRLFSLAGSSSLAALLSGCGTLDRGSPVPRTATLKASVIGLPNERFFPMVGTDPLEAEFVAALNAVVGG